MPSIRDISLDTKQARDFPLEQVDDGGTLLCERRFDFTPESCHAVTAGKAVPQPVRQCRTSPRTPDLLSCHLDLFYRISAPKKRKILSLSTHLTKGVNSGEVL